MPRAFQCTIFRNVSRQDKEADKNSELVLTQDTDGNNVEKFFFILSYFNFSIVSF